MAVKYASVAGLAVADQEPAVATPYTVMSEEGLRAVAGSGKKIPPLDFDFGDIFAVSSQLDAWLRHFRPAWCLLGAEAEEPNISRHVFLLRTPEGRIVSAPWGDLEELQKVATEATLRRARMAQLWDIEDGILSADGELISPAWLRSILPKLRFRDGRRLGERVLIALPPEGSSDEDRAWGGFQHTTVHRFIGEARRSYAESVRSLHSSATVETDAETARRFGLLPAVVTDGSIGRDDGPSQPIISVTSPPPSGVGLMSSAENELRGSSLIPAEELDSILTCGQAIFAIPNHPYNIFRLGQALGPNLTWFQEGLISVKVRGLRDYLEVKNLAAEARTDLEGGFTTFFAAETESWASLIGEAVREAYPDIQTTVVAEDDAQFPAALFVHFEGRKRRGEAFGGALVGSLKKLVEALKAKLLSSELAVAGKGGGESNW